ncbi:hypothetical protein [Kiloniella sp.]|uniref:hypothetical protein n=1 Tax=Kiloniella sp. TaxID=1938587 RepID=UPI003B0177EA
MTIDAQVVEAQSEIDCPTTISTFDSGYLTEVVESTLKKIYEKLNCRVKFVPVPGRRGIALFNALQVNGEAMRLSKVEQLYTREYVRSHIPLLDLVSSLWVHPDHYSEGNRPIGYTLGIVWQEKYAENKRAKRYRGIDELINAYNRGKISGFLASDITVILAIQTGRVETDLIRKEVIFSAPIYHYLGDEFSPFMKRFSNYLKKNTPFKEIEDLQN